MRSASLRPVPTIDPVLDGYLAGIDPAARALVTRLDAVIRGAHPAFDVAIKYRLLMYSLHADWRFWVCALDAKPARVSLRFLYGVILDDPRHVLRAGSSVLETWDFGIHEEIDEAAVAAYVTEAVERHAEYKARANEILVAGRAGSKAARRQGAG